MYDTNAYSTQVLDPNENRNSKLRRSNRKIPYDELDPYNTPKIVELDENNNAILPPNDSFRSKKRNRSRNNSVILQEIPPAMLPFASTQPYAPQAYMPYNPNTVIIQDEQGNHISRLVSPSTVVLQPPPPQPFFVPSSVPAVPLLIQQQPVFYPNLSSKKKGYPNSKNDNLALIREDIDDSMIKVGRYQRKKSDYIFCCGFYGQANTDTCKYCWNLCGCPMWFTFVLGGIFALAVAVLVVIIILIKYSYI